MFLFIDTIKRFLDDDHGAPINNKETLQKLLKRYRVNSMNPLNSLFDHYFSVGYACRSNEPSNDH